jgi:hypothetical protein
MGSYVFLAVRTLAVVVIAASTWPLVSDAYDRLIAAAASSFAPGEVALSAASGRIYLSFDGAGDAGRLSIEGIVLHFCLILMTALVVSTPGLSPYRVAGWLPAVFGILFGLHVAGLALLARGLDTAYGGGRDGSVVGQVMSGFAIFWGLLPAVLGGLWCYRYWLPGLRELSIRHIATVDNTPTIT